MTEADQKEKPNFDDVANGPLDESQRECRDVFCCLLFLVNIAAMVYVTVHAYTSGNPDKIFRGIAANVVCGEPGGVAEQFPYVYFYNPIFSTDSRVCVATCPTFTSGTLNTVSCYAGHGVTCTYDVTFDSNGSTTVSTSTLNSSSYFLGYETTPVMGRLCLPSSAVIANGLATVITSLTTALEGSSFGNLVSDVENVQHF